MEPRDPAESSGANGNRRDETTRSDRREDRVREIQRLVRANRYDFEGKLPVALTRLLNDVVE